MIQLELTNKRILVTHADTFMGPAMCKIFGELGAEVLADTRPLLSEKAVQSLVSESGHIDVLVLNLALVPIPHTPVAEVSDEEWREGFAALVDPMQRMMRAVLPQMMERKSGKILLMGSASALRGQKLRSTHTAARGAQTAYIKAVGVEMAPYNIQINAIAQNFVESASYYDAAEQDRVRDRLKNDVPLGRIIRADEDARFAAYLCSDAADCFVGQVFPMCGGWAH